MQCDELLKSISAFCCENQISVNVSQQMPEGYENAFGTYDVTVNTLYINLQILKNSPQYEALFYVYHELRHALQYLKPERFGEAIRRSTSYVILYNGTCFKLTGNNWRQCWLEGAEYDFINAYLSMPYERDANEYAYQQTKLLCGDSAELDRLYDMWKPAFVLQDAECRKLFCLIDSKIE